MAIPDYQSLMRPALAVLHDHGPCQARDIPRLVASALSLTDAELAERMDSGRRCIDIRVGWAITYLVKAGLVERPRRGMCQLTDEGLAILQKFPERVDNTVLSRYPQFVEFTKPTTTSEKGTRNTDEDAVLETPADLIQRARRENNSAVTEELLERLRAIDPLTFEDLVVRLLGAMGYGRQGGTVERTVATGDAGIDGIISQDPLGLDRIYVQAKRYRGDVAVGRPDIQGFAGALMSAQGDRGVFMTTSRFTREATDAAERIGARIELVDGERLTQLMVAYGVGVQVTQTVALHRVDEDFFDAL